MQIHELNNYSGNLDSEAFLAVDNGSDTGKVSTTELLADTNAAVSQLDTFLNGRIDNIIAGGEAPSASEIVDARYGADGVTYPSLGDAIRDQVTDLQSELNDLTDDTTNILSINMFDKRLASLGGFVANTNGEFTPSSNYFATDYIPVTVGQYRRKNFNNWYCCFYDTNKNFVEQIPYETDTMTFTESGFIRLSGTIANIDTCMVWKGSESIATYVPYIRSPHYIPSPMDFGAKGDGVTIDNVALNNYFKYCYDYGIDADGFGRTYLVDDSTVTFTDAETSSVHYGVKAYGARKIQNFNFVLADGVNPLTPCLTVIISDMGATRVENCSFRGGTSTNTGAEDGGNHGILFVKDRMFPAYWQELANVYVDNCVFSRIWSYGIFLTPINAVFRVSNCQFGCGGPAILTYATKSFINNCVYAWTGRAGQIDTLCIDEIENFNNVATAYKKNIYISNCKSSRQIHHISEQVQRSVSYGNVVIDKCYSDDKIFQTYDEDTETDPTIVIDNLVIRDSFCGLLSGNSRIITLNHLDGNAVFDNFCYSDNGYSGWVINKSKGSIYLKETKTPTLLDITDSEIEFLSPNYSTINV